MDKPHTPVSNDWSYIVRHDTYTLDKFLDYLKDTGYDSIEGFDTVTARTTLYQRMYKIDRDALLKETEELARWQQWVKLNPPLSWATIAALLKRNGFTHGSIDWPIKKGFHVRKQNEHTVRVDYFGPTKSLATAAERETARSEDEARLVDIKRCLEANDFIVQTHEINSRSLLVSRKEVPVD